MSRKKNLPDDFYVAMVQPGTNLDSVYQQSLTKFENRFPVEAFPSRIRAIIDATKNSLNYPPDFTGAAVLFAASVAIGNTRRIRVKNGMELGAVIYIALVGRPNSVKSHPLTFAVRPLVDADQAAFRQYEEQRLLYEKLNRMSPKQRQKEGQQEPGNKPVRQTYLLSDYTPEALAEVHKFNLRGIGVKVDELAGWFKGFNKYTKGKGGEMEFWLSAWSGSNIAIDRKGSNSIFIQSPFISVAGTIQTGILKDFAAEGRTENGFMDRVLFSFPENTQKPSWTDDELHPSVLEDWTRILEALMNLPLPFESGLKVAPLLLSFTDKAKQRLFQWQKELTEESNEADSDALAGIIGKMDIQAPRLALVLEMLRFACGESDGKQVGIEALEGALLLTEYFKETSVRVHDVINSADYKAALPEDKQRLFNALPDRFTAAEMKAAAKELKIPERNGERLLTNRKLFRQISRGQYEKKQTLNT
jgi:hypothetical protein